MRKGGPDTVDGHVSATHDHDLFPFGIGVPSEIDLQKVENTRDESLISLVFSFDAHGRIGMGAHTDEDGLISLFKDLREGDILSHLGVVTESRPPSCSRIPASYLMMSLGSR